MSPTDKNKNSKTHLHAPVRPWYMDCVLDSRIIEENGSIQDEMAFEITDRFVGY